MFSVSGSGEVCTGSGTGRRGLDKSVGPDSLEGVADRRGLVTHPGLYGATEVMPTTSLSAESADDK